MPTHQFRPVVFTDFTCKKWTEEDLQEHKLQYVMYGEEMCPTTGKKHHQSLQYVMYGEEMCPTTGKKHHQSWAYSINPRSFEAFKKMFAKTCNNCWFSEIKGSLKQNDQYCSKDGKFTKIGIEPVEKCQKRKLIEYKHEIEEGKKVIEIAENDHYFPTYIQNSRALKEYEQYIRTKKLRTNREKLDVFIRFGPSGTGKTKWLDDTDLHSSVFGR